MLVDSDLVANFLKGRQGVVSFMTPLSAAGLAISIVTYAEVYEGVFYGRARRHYERVFTKFVRGVDVLPITRTVAKRYAVLSGQLRTAGQLLDQPDLFIASTALSTTISPC